MKRSSPRPSRRSAICQAINEPETGPKAELIELAAQYADEWYEANAMPCGSQNRAESYHQSCRANVEARCRSTMGMIGLLTVSDVLFQSVRNNYERRKIGNVGDH